MDNVSNIELFDWMHRRDRTPVQDVAVETIHWS